MNNTPAADLALLNLAMNPNQQLSGECYICTDDALPGTHNGFELCIDHMSDEGALAARAIERNL